VAVRRGRSVKKSLAATADNVKELHSVSQNKSVAVDEAVVDKQGHIDESQSHSDTAVAAVESSDIGSNVEQLLVGATAVECSDVVDIPSSSVTQLSSLESGTLYVLQPVESVAQNIGCRTLRLLRAADDQDEVNTATPTVLVAASAADMISSSADLAHFLCSAGITGVKAELVNHAAESTT